QARRSSRSICASLARPVSVRSPHSTNTSAASEISPNSSRSELERSSLTCRSPMAATLSVLNGSVTAPLAFAADIGKAPLLHGDFVIRAREHAAAADLHARRRQIELLLHAAEQLIHEPTRNMVAFA